MNRFLIFTASVMMMFGYSTAYAVDSNPKPPVCKTCVGQPGPIGPSGPTGPQGEQGPAGVSITDPAFQNMLQTRTPTGGQWTFAGGINFNQDGATSVTTGVRYGLNDCVDLVGAVDLDRNDNVAGYFGFTMALNKCNKTNVTPIYDYHAPYTGNLK